MKLRINPWFTDGCTLFLNNIFKWYPGVLKTKLTVLEFGGGNSTLFFLQKKAKVVTIESDDVFIADIKNVALQLGYKVHVADKLFSEFELIETNDLIIIKSVDIKEIKFDIFTALDWTFIVNDGISRKDIVSKIQSSNLTNSIIIIDNIEYCANWGHLDRSSAKPDLVSIYRKILRDTNWTNYIFEQPEGRDSHAAADTTGWEAPHRWASAVLWNKEHLLNKFIISNLGFPIVNINGIDDSDINTLGERCPYDWKKMQWLKEPFSTELDLKLVRKFD